MSAAPEPRDGIWSLVRTLGPAALLAAAAALYAPILRLWWTDDDFYVLHVLHGRSLAGAALSPEVWRQSGMFTPLLLLSFGADLAAAGPRPRFFYLHQLAALAAAAVAVWAVLRLWLPRAASFSAALLFLLGAPAGAWAQELLVRHYAEGLVLAALATRLFVLSLRRERAGLAFGSAALYLLAMLEKEVYVPLPALLLLLPERDARRRWRRLAPHAAALGLYLAMRRAALGGLAGGYGWTVRVDEIPLLLAALPARAAAAVAGGHPAWDAVLAVALAIGIAAAFRRNGAKAAGLLLAGLALALGPVLPVSKAFQPRYAGLAWLAIAVAFAFGCAALASAGPPWRAAAIALAAAAGCAALAVNRRGWAPRLALAERMGAEGRAFLDLGRGDYLRHPSIPPAAMNELRWWKEDGLGLRRGAGWFADDLYLCAHRGGIARLYEYAGRERRVVEETALMPAIGARYCGGLRDAPLAADFSYSGGDFSWDLGPYAAGKWAIVYGDGVERFDVAPRDGYRHHASVFTLRIRYESPEGWVTFSPDIPLDFRASPRIRWERGAQRAS